MRPSKAKGDYVVHAATGEIGANRIGPSSGDPPSRDSTPDATTSAEDGDGGAAASQTVVDPSTQGTVPPATPAPVSCKRSSSSVPASTVKRARTAADSLTALGDRVGEFTEAFREANVVTGIRHTGCKS
ncbi:hypothetical protein EXIGLDRAFT_70581 [Exidia glandulosa HHB12029]|uniref:Uncharacterized protein n=1 Tax=Exidia glandulosa HHB12029 TaxID=1314781 RepID=A0A166AJU9_EXIGL|nr:hypothetical protein EXIGLDRAFT_70581 [Exidia glandulosa HHB12029]